MFSSWLRQPWMPGSHKLQALQNSVLNARKTFAGRSSQNGSFFPRLQCAKNAAQWMIVSWNVWSPPKAAWSAWKSFPVILSQILSGSAGQSPSVNCVLRNNRFPRSSIPSSASNARWRRRRMRSAKLSGSTLARLAQLAKSAVRRTCGNGSLTLPRSMVANARKTLELAKPLALNVGRHRMSQKHFVGCCTCLWLHCPAPWLFLYTTCIYIYTLHIYINILHVYIYI